MPAPESSPRSSARPRGERRLTLALWLAIVVAIVPLQRVVGAGWWQLGAAALPAVILGVGYGLRRLRVPAWGATLGELVVWAAIVTAVFLPEASVLRVIPTGAVFDAVPLLVEAAANEILVGAAPLPPTLALSFTIVAALGVLTIALDHVAITARMPLLGSAALVMVWLIPAIAVPSGVDAVTFVLLAVTLLVLIRAETRTRESTASTQAAGVTAFAITIGVVAISTTLVIAPSLPAPVGAITGSRVSATIDATLDLGRDLRRRSDVTVLTERSDAPQLPNLRVATLSVFDGEVWQPDRTRSMSLAERELDPVIVSDGIRVTEYRTTIEITQLSSAYLPIPYPAVAVTGLEGVWRSAPYGRTILTAQSNAQGQTYEVVTHVPRPTLEQIRATTAISRETVVDVTSLPAGTPAVIGELAREVTAGATTDYDRLIALQGWFRGAEFTYSLDTPVREGFDGTGADAVAAFLEVKEGYCVHYASAFALMARSLGMPSRVVVGFLPGQATSDSIDGQRVSNVTTEQLHAWPEVEFDGIGWVAFEPTKSLGTATRFTSSASVVDDPGTDVTDATNAPAPASSADASAGEIPQDRLDEASGTAARVADPRPYLLVTVVILIVVLAPAAGASVRRGLLRRRGTTGAAWRLVQDTAIDLGVAVPASESPRAFGTRLVRSQSAPRPEISRLIAAVERASYAKDSGFAPADRNATSMPDAESLRDAEQIRRGMLSARSAAVRARALLLPRSLIVRPDSALAERGDRADPPHADERHPQG